MISDEMARRVQALDREGQAVVSDLIDMFIADMKRLHRLHHLAYLVMWLSGVALGAAAMRAWLT